MNIQVYLKRLYDWKSEIGEDSKMSEARIIDTIEIPESGFYKMFDIGRGRGGRGRRLRLREREVYSHYDSDVKVLFWGGARFLPVLKYGVSSTPAPRRT